MGNPSIPTDGPTGLNENPEDKQETISQMMQEIQDWRTEENVRRNKHEQLANSILGGDTVEDLATAIAETSRIADEFSKLREEK